MHDDHRIILTDGDMMASAIDSCAGDARMNVVLMITRREIERGLVGDAVDRLMVLSDSPVYTRRFGGKLLIVVDGYDADPRELHQITECRDFFRTINASWPFWFHFAERQTPSTSTLGVIALMLLDTEVVSRNGRMIGSAITPASLQGFFDGQFAGLNALYAFHGISTADNIATTDAVLAALERMFQPPSDGGAA